MPQKSFYFSDQPGLLTLLYNLASSYTPLYSYFLIFIPQSTFYEIIISSTSNYKKHIIRNRCNKLLYYSTSYLSTSYPGLIYQNNGNWIVIQVIVFLFDNSMYKFQHIFVVWQKLRHNLYPYQHTLAGKPHIVIAAGNPIIYAMKQIYRHYLNRKQGIMQLYARNILIYLLLSSRWIYSTHLGLYDFGIEKEQNKQKFR